MVFATLSFRQCAAQPFRTLLVVAAIARYAPLRTLFPAREELCSIPN